MTWLGEDKIKSIWINLSIGTLFERSRVQVPHKDKQIPRYFIKILLQHNSNRKKSKHTTST